MDRMDTSHTSFTAKYVEWLRWLRMYYFGTVRAQPPVEPTPRQEQAAAHQEWEHEGGSVRPAPTHPDAEPAPKLPL